MSCKSALLSFSLPLLLGHGNLEFVAGIGAFCCVPRYLHGEITQGGVLDAQVADALAGRVTDLANPAARQCFPVLGPKRWPPMALGTQSRPGSGCL